MMVRLTRSAWRAGLGLSCGGLLALSVPIMAQPIQAIQAVKAVPPVYTCKQGDKTLYSQQPCQLGQGYVAPIDPATIDQENGPKPARSTDSPVKEPTNVAPINPASGPADRVAKPTTPAEKSPQTVVPAYTQAMTAALEFAQQQQKERQIAQHYRQIERYKSQLKTDFGQLKAVRFRTEADKTAAVQALTDKYQPLILQQQQAIKQLLQPATPAVSSPSSSENSSEPR